MLQPVNPSPVFPDAAVVRASTSKVGNYTTAAADVVLWTPQTGQRVVVSGFLITGTGPASLTEIKLFDETDSAANWILIYPAIASEVLKLYVTLPIPRPLAAIGNSLKKTHTGTWVDLRVIAMGYEVIG